MNCDDILKEWEIDCKIDTMDVDISAQQVPELHSKYLNIFIAVTKKQTKLRDYMKKLRHKKKLYYNGQLSKEAMDKLGWDYNPYKGAMKPLKSEQKEWIDVDEDIMKVQETINENDIILETVGSILEQIKWRNQTIRNVIDYRKFIHEG